MSRFRNAEHGPRSKKFIRVYSYHGRGGVGFNLAVPDFGEAYKKAVTDQKIMLEIHRYGERHAATTVSKSIRMWWTPTKFRYFEFA